jgi:HEAT repeat protein
MCHWIRLVRDRIRRRKQSRIPPEPQPESQPHPEAEPQESADLPSQPEVESAPDIPELISRLTHAHHSVRIAAAEALGRIGPDAVEAIPYLLRAAVVDDADVQEAMMKALVQIDPAWCKNSESEKAIPGLVEALEGERSSDTVAASRLLTQIGPPAIPELIAALADEEHAIRQVWVARTLERIGTQAASAVPALAKALKSEQSHVREAVAEALCAFGPAAEPAVPALVFSLADWHPGVRCTAARCLARIGGAAELGTAGLIQLLADRDDKVREAAFEALREIGPGTVPFLIEILQTRDLRRMTEWLKWRVEVSDWCRRPIDEDFQREPLKALRNATWYFQHAMDEHVRVEAVHEAALRLLADFGPAASAAVPVATQALRDPNPRLRLAAAFALGNIGPAAKTALPDLVSSLVDNTQPVREAAPEALGKIDPTWASSQEIQPSIVWLVKRLGASKKAGEVAVQALALIGPPCVPALVEGLKQSPNRTADELAATALGLIGPGAREAIPALVQLLNGDSHPWVQQAALKALQKIDPEGKLWRRD